MKEFSATIPKTTVKQARPVYTYRPVRLERLRLEFQPPENLDEETVQRYVAQIEGGEHLKPIRVFWDGKEYWLNDGFHRVAAARRIGTLELKAAIVRGSWKDMQADYQDFLAELKRKLSTASSGAQSGARRRKIRQKTAKRIDQS